MISVLVPQFSAVSSPRSSDEIGRSGHRCLATNLLQGIFFCIIEITQRRDLLCQKLLAQFSRAFGSENFSAWTELTQIILFQKLSVKLMELGNITGSRYSDGNVPNVNWNSDNRKVNVNWYNPDNADDNIRSRSEVSAKKSF
jgi:hypothetical protein